MLRALVVLLLVANMLFFAWARGWLAPVLPPRADQREPARVAAQLRPELITVLSAGAASAAVAAASSAASAAAGAASGAASEPAHEAEGPPICLEAGPFTEAALKDAETVLTGHGVPDGQVQREFTAGNVTWGVVMGRFPDRDTLRAKADELKRLGVKYDELYSPPSLAPGLRLGNYSDRYGAEAALASLATKGVRTARVAQLPAGPVQNWLRAPRADAELQTRLKALPPDKLGAGFRPCAPPKKPA